MCTLLVSYYQNSNGIEDVEQRIPAVNREWKIDSTMTQLSCAFKLLHYWLSIIIGMKLNRNKITQPTLKHYIYTTSYKIIYHCTSPQPRDDVRGTADQPKGIEGISNDLRYGPSNKR